MSTVSLAEQQFSTNILAKIFASEPANKNVVISPLSIHLASSMALVGANDDAFTEMIKALRLDTLTDRNTINTEMQKILQQMDNSRKSKVVNLANKIFVGQEFPIKQIFQHEVTTYFQSTSQSLDFKNQPDPSRLIINKWV